jgi:hypothetical protein
MTAQPPNPWQPLETTIAKRSRPLSNPSSLRKDFSFLHELVLACGGHHHGVWIVRKDNDRCRAPWSRVVNHMVTLAAWQIEQMASVAA